MLAHIRTLECALHDPATRRDRKRFYQLLNPEFWEIGRSGTIYTGAEVLESLPSEETAVVIHA